jgi:molecular chaperone HtpG
MKQAGQDMPSSKPVLEINPLHPILQRMKDTKDEQQLEEWSKLLFEQAVLAEGGQLEDPATFVARMNQIILDIAQ